MISKKLFLEKIEYLQQLYNVDLSLQQVEIYYEKLNRDMNDAALQKTIDLLIENEYKFPPIASFYKYFDRTWVADDPHAEARRRILAEVD